MPGMELSNDEYKPFATENAVENKGIWPSDGKTLTAAVIKSNSDLWILEANAPFGAQPSSWLDRVTHLWR